MLGSTFVCTVCFCMVKFVLHVGTMFVRMYEQVYLCVCFLLWLSDVLG